MVAEFNGRVAVVTGGASGIGAEVVGELLSRGARVAALDLQPEGAPDGALRVHVDVADSTSVRRAVASVVADVGGIDILINNAGIGAEGTLERVDDDE